MNKTPTPTPKELYAAAEKKMEELKKVLLKPLPRLHETPQGKAALTQLTRAVVKEKK